MFQISILILNLLGNTLKQSNQILLSFISSFLYLSFAHDLNLKCLTSKFLTSEWFSFLLLISIGSHLLGLECVEWLSRQTQIKFSFYILKASCSCPNALVSQQALIVYVIYLSFSAILFALHVLIYLNCISLRQHT